MIADINKDVQVRSTDGFVQTAFAFSAPKARAVGIYQIIVLDITAERGVVMRGIPHIPAEGHKIIVNAASQLFCGVQCNDL